MQKHGNTLVDLAGEQVKQAEAALAIAEKDLRDAVVYAPIDGKVSQRFQEPGEMSKIGNSIIRIDKTSEIEVSAYLPAQYYERIHQRETPLRLMVSGNDVGTHVITYKSPTINPSMRTFEIKCVLHNPPEGVVPGAIAEIEVLLQQHRGLGVPSAAIQQRNGSAVIFVSEANVAKMVAVKAGIETDGWVEILDNSLKEKAPVVTMGQTLIDDGTPVKTRSEAQ